MPSKFVTASIAAAGVASANAYTGTISIPGLSSSACETIVERAATFSSASADCPQTGTQKDCRETSGTYSQSYSSSFCGGILTSSVSTCSPLAWVELASTAIAADLSESYVGTFAGAAGSSDFTLTSGTCEYKYSLSSSVNVASAGGIVAGLSAVVMMLL